MNDLPTLWRLSVALVAPLPDAHVDVKSRTALRSRIFALAVNEHTHGFGLTGGASPEGTPIIRVMLPVRAGSPGAAVDVAVTTVAAAVRDTFAVDALLYEVTVTPINAIVPGQTG